MVGQILANPLGALAGRPSSGDFTAWLDKDGLPLDYPHSSYWFRANAAVTVGQLVSFVDPTSTNPLSVTPSGTTDTTIVVGVAKNTAAAGEMVEVVTSGFCLALFESAVTPAADNAVINGGTTAGSVAVDTALDATNVVGTVLGVVLAAKLTSFAGSAHYAPVWLYRI